MLLNHFQPLTAQAVTFPVPISVLAISISLAPLCTESIILRNSEKHEGCHLHFLFDLTQTSFLSLIELYNARN